MVYNSTQRIYSSKIAPDPSLNLLWMDLNEDPYGSIIKYWNGAIQEYRVISGGGSSSTNAVYNITLNKPIVGYYDLVSAIASSPDEIKAPGLIMIFLANDDKYDVYQFIGKDESEWNNYSLWNNLSSPINEAPSNNKTYGRKNNSWVEVINGEAVIPTHNELIDIQGGIESERYHLSQSQLDRVLNIIYIPMTSSISISTPSSGYAEKGVSTNVSFAYSITPNDDTITSATINSVSIIDNIDGTTKYFSAGSQKSSYTASMIISYDRDGVIESQTKNSTFNAYNPQWIGVSSSVDFYSYSELNSSSLTKFIQSSASKNATVSPSNEYIWFISNSAGRTIKDGNDFTQTVGAWGNGSTEFYYKSITIKLSDGQTDFTAYLYRSRNQKTLTNFTYKIS